MGKSNINILKDKRVNCYSIMMNMTTAQYLKLVQEAYEKKGGIEGQREALKTNTSIRIRNRMIDDLFAGAVLPPVVLGIIVDEETFNKLETTDLTKFKGILASTPKENIAIIDGMQRTTALMEVDCNKDIKKHQLRVEFWIATSTNSLIYRMLILNTGQVPWNLRRQLEVIFQAMLVELKKKVPDIILLEVDDKMRRSDAGQFQADQIIELFLVFGARKEKIDTRERLAEEFTRLDFIEATSERRFTEIFYEAIDFLVKLDKLFCIYKDKPINKEPSDEKEKKAEKERFTDGRDLFNSQPARVGLITAIGLEVMGRPGASFSTIHQEKRWNELKEQIESLISRLDKMDANEMGQFLDFTTLNEAITKRSARLGDFEREFFLKAFRTLIEEEFDVSNLTPCWRAY